jgi:hypothetical protein
MSFLLCSRDFLRPWGIQPLECKASLSNGAKPTQNKIKCAHAWLREAARHFRVAGAREIQESMGWVRSRCCCACIDFRFVDRSTHACHESTIGMVDSLGGPVPLLANITFDVVRVLPLQLPASTLYEGLWVPLWRRRLAASWAPSGAGGAFSSAAASAPSKNQVGEGLNPCPHRHPCVRPAEEGDQKAEEAATGEGCRASGTPNSASILHQLGRELCARVSPVLVFLT